MRPPRHFDADAIPMGMPIPSPVLEAINLELGELEAVAARIRELEERELLDVYPQIAAVRDALRALTEELERRT